MKNWAWLGLFLVGLVPLQGQIEDPVKWAFEAKKVNAQECDLLFTATIQDGWNIYSQYLESDDGPVRTSFRYDAGAHFKLVGKNEENGVRKEGYDKLFDMNVIKLFKKVVFRQRVRVNDWSQPITGGVEFMCCDEEKCLPPTEIPFRFVLSPPAPASPAAPAAPSQGNNAPEGAALAPPLEPGLLDAGPATPTAPGLQNPVTWKVAIAALGDQTYQLQWVAEIAPGWNIYSQFTDPGPIPTSFQLTPGPHYQLLGKIAEAGKKKAGPDPLFGGNQVIKILAGQAIFTAKVKVADPEQAVTGQLEYMACDGTRCLAPTSDDFSFVPATLTATLGTPTLDAAVPALPQTRTDNDIFAGLAQPNLDQPLANCGTAAPPTRQGNLGTLFFLGFIGGLLALLTPCVFPMIPLTVSFFTKNSGNRKRGFYQASLYGFFILLVYVLLSLPFHLLDNVNPDILNDVSTNVWLNLVFFAIFLFFAFSFFGYYEIELPERWRNRSSSAEGIGGVVGTFFMALTLALVSFSCTGPILGSLLAGALSGDGGAIQLTAGMSGFGLALALPFAFFAAFPGVMKALPKSGGWMNTVKVVLGFIELALALKFLSNADLVKNWGILRIEAFLGLWLVLALGLGAYLLGWLRFPHDDHPRRISWTERGLGLLALLFAVYLGSGFRYNPTTGTFNSLTLLSGLAPPVGYSWLYPNECPQNLNCFKDLDAGMAYARQQNKPVMIDFTGHACVNCRKMEENVWPKNSVLPLLAKDYVLISLYVDDKRELPEQEQVTVQTYNGNTRKLRTIGNKWSHFQTTYFKTNTQPYYVLLAPDGKVLTDPVGYTPNPEAYRNFLQCGKEAFNRLSMK